MGSGGVFAATGVTKRKAVGMHAFEVRESMPEQTNRIGVDVSILMHKIIKGGLASDENTCRRIADSLHGNISNFFHLPDETFMVLDKSIVEVKRWVEQDLEAKPVFVFDGAVPPVKQAEKDHRLAKCLEAYQKARAATNSKERISQYRASVYIPWEMVQFIISLCIREGIEYYVAIGEADAQLAHMCNMGEIHMVIDGRFRSRCPGSATHSFRNDEGSGC